MKKSIVVGAILLLLSLIHPIAFYYYEGEHKIVNEHTYLSRNNNDSEIQKLEKFDQYRIIYHAYKNIKLGRYDSFSTIDDNNVINSFPLYKYYSPALFYILGLLMFVFHDVVIVFTMALWVFSLLYVVGIYLLAEKFSKDRATAVLLAGVAITAPYMATNTLSRYSLSEEAAGFMVPMLVYWFLELLEKGKHSLPPKSKQRFDYLVQATFFTALGTLFVLTHNITTLYTPLIYAIPLGVYLYFDVRPTWRSVGLLLIPFLFMFLGSLFYIVPSMQTQSTLLISNLFGGLLFPYFDLLSFGTLFGFLPSMSKISTTPALWLQIGWPTLILVGYFFRSRTIPLFSVFFFILIAMLSPKIWELLPPTFLAIQFPYRLLAYLPLLVVLGARKIAPRSIGGIGILTVVCALIFFPRNSVPGKFYTYDFEMFPSVNNWNYYVKNDENLVLAGISIPKESTISAGPRSPSSASEKIPPATENASAVTYRFTLPDAGSQKRMLKIATATTYLDGEKNVNQQQFTIAGLNSFISSYCLRNTKDHTIRVTVEPQLQSPIVVSRFADTSQMFIPTETQYFPVPCSYDVEAGGRTYIFHPKPDAKPVILPVFFSTLNRVVDKDGNDLGTKSLLDGENRSYTVIDNPAGNDTIRITLFGNDSWTSISYPVLYGVVIALVVALLSKVSAVISFKKKL